MNTLGSSLKVLAMMLNANCLIYRLIIATEMVENTTSYVFSYLQPLQLEALKPPLPYFLLLRGNT